MVVVVDESEEKENAAELQIDETDSQADEG